MLDKEIKEEQTTPTEAEPQTEPISEPQAIIQPEPEIIAPVEAESTPTPQRLEALGKITPEPEIVPEIENIEIIEPISTETLNEVKPEETPLEPANLPEEEGTPDQIVEPVKTETQPEIKPEPQPIQSTPAPAVISTKTKMHELFIKAQNAIQTRKRKKLNKVMNMFLTQEIITNDEVEKLLHVSDSTATRYLAILKKEGKIKQNGNTGKWVNYSKI